jgi:4-amino-4-deoxy-L-arabinose transferase-like glycosyltransferase
MTNAMPQPAESYSGQRGGHGVSPPNAASGPTGRERWLLAGLVLLSLGLHLFYVRGPRVVWGDEPFYLWIGRNWLTGQGYQFMGFTDVHHPPLYPLLSGLLYLVTRNLEVASNLLYLFFGPLLVLPIAGIGQRLYGPRAGLLSGLLVALWPPFNAAVPWWGTMTEPPYYFFVALGIWAAVVAADLGPANENSDLSSAAGSRRSFWPWGLAGLAFGLAYLTRPEGIWYAPAVGGALLVGAWLRRMSWRRWLTGALLFALGFIAGFLPYAVHTRINTGSWMVSEKVGITFQDGMALARGDMAEHDRVLYQLDSSGKQVFFFSRESFHLSMLDQIRAQPRAYAGVLYLNLQNLLGRFFTVEDFMPALLPLLGLGLFGLAWTRRRFYGELILIAALVPPLSFLLFFIFTRYLSPLLFPMLVWSGLGLALLSDWFRGTGMALQPRWARIWRGFGQLLPVLVVAGVLLITHHWTLTAVTETQAVRPEHRAAGEWLAAHTPADAVVMARYPAVAFHADRHWVPSPNSDYQAALSYAAANGVSYWVVDGNESQFRPQLAFLAEGSPPPELELVFSVPTAGKPVYVYRVR